MNLDGLTEDQKAAVTHKSGPLLVSAGAGSGKTFMLTQRIAYLFSEESGPFLNDIDEVCAITFTNKAAGEIKDRIRCVLQDKGLIEQAQKVDSAWISTIHGMCSRILKTYAIELNIDPEFKIVVDADQQKLLDSAFDTALAQLTDETIEFLKNSNILFYDLKDKSSNEDVSGIFSPLLKEYGIGSQLQYSEDLKSIVLEIVNKLNIEYDSNEKIFQGLNFELNIVFEINNLLEELKLIENYICSSPSNAAQKAYGQVTQSIKVLQVFIENIPKNNDYEFITKCLDAVNSCSVVPENFGNQEVKEHVKEFNAYFCHLCANIKARVAEDYLQVLMCLARQTLEQYSILKKQKSLLDNNDLLIKTFQAFEFCPEIKKNFHNKFKIVMVDEFQDTSQLQVDVIKNFVGNTNNLCTVGDVQQSIYRFQGADVSVYKKHKKYSLENDAKYVELAINFRSHDSVLKFVEKIFSHNNMFGRDFLHLDCNPEFESAYNCDIPRTQVILACKYGRSNSSLALHACAIKIAQQFLEYKKAGKRPGDMVLLLGVMTNVDVYASVLQNYGFDCVIAGGSAFAKTKEVQNVLCLAHFLANKNDTTSLYNVLTSGMFNLSAYQIDYIMNKGCPKCNVCDTNIHQADEVLTLLHEASKIVFKESLHEGIRYVVNNSSWLYRLQNGGASQLAQAANIIKALRIIYQNERECNAGIQSILDNLDLVFGDDSKISPGSLSVSNNDAIKIMTIHASKGLQFPIVAVAEYAKKPRAPKMLIEQSAKSTIYSLNMGSLFSYNYPNIEKAVKKYSTLEDDIDESLNLSAAQQRLLLERIFIESECQEDKRKLYVALTRAQEAVILCTSASINKDGEFSSLGEVDKDLFSSLGLDTDVNFGMSTLADGSSGGISVDMFDIEQFLSSENCAENDNEDDDKFLQITPIKYKSYSYENCKSVDSDMFSFSKLSNSKLMCNDKIKYEEYGVECIADTKDSDKATDFGTAFHRLMQYIWSSSCKDTEIDTNALAQKFFPSNAVRLSNAANSFLNSGIFRKVLNFEFVDPEVDFCVPLKNNNNLHGQIDLLCSNSRIYKDEDIFLLDYKTGQHKCSNETILHEKHMLQAMCYVYALLCEGAKSVNIVFVYVENGCLQVEYEFLNSDKERLCLKISGYTE